MATEGNTTSPKSEDNVDKQPTQLVHMTYDGNFQHECDAKILSFQITELNNDAKKDEKEEEEEEEEVAASIQLDITTMHPQGGGQPTDIGTITITNPENNNNTVIIRVDKVTIDRETNIVTHHGRTTNTNNIQHSTTTSSSSLPLYRGIPVRVSVDTMNRRILSECHTAGHVIDSAMSRIGMMMPPTKGYHFMDGPYVEYRGVMTKDVKERNVILDRLKDAFQELVQEDIDTKIETLPKDRAESLCNRLSQNFDFSMYQTDTVRIVTVAGWPCPCGGTHVKSTSELRDRGWNVTGMKCKKGLVRIKYGPKR